MIQGIRIGDIQHERPRHRNAFATEFDGGVADAEATVPQLSRRPRRTHLVDRAERAFQKLHVLLGALHMESWRDGAQGTRGLSADTVYAIRVDGRGRVWVGTRGAGVDEILGSALTPERIRFRNYSEAQGLPKEFALRVRVGTFFYAEPAQRAEPAQQVTAQPPAESPAMNVARAGPAPAGPFATSQLWARTQSSRPAGKGCSGASR